MREAERLGELGADRPAALADALAELGQPLGPDHRAATDGAARRRSAPASTSMRHAASPSRPGVAATGALAS